MPALFHPHPAPPTGRLLYSVIFEDEVYVNNGDRLEVIVSPDHSSAHTVLHRKDGRKRVVRCRTVPGTDCK